MQSFPKVLVNGNSNHCKVYCFILWLIKRRNAESGASMLPKRSLNIATKPSSERDTRAQITD